MRKLHTFIDVEQEFKRVYRRLRSLSGSGSGGGGIDDVLAEGQALTANRQIDLNGKVFKFWQVDDHVLLLDPNQFKALISATQGGESGTNSNLVLYADPLGEGVTAHLVSQTGGNNADILLDGANETITHTADTHTFVAGGNNYIELDGVGFNSRIRAEDGTASSQLLVTGDLVGNNVKFTLSSNDGTANPASILGDGQTSSITHIADIHTFNANAQTALFIDGTTNGEVSELKATNITGGGNLSKLNLSVSDVNGGFNLSTAFDNESKEAKIVGAVTSGSSSITHTADRYIFNNIQEFPNNAAAIAGGLPVGALYRSGDNLEIVH